MRGRQQVNANILNQAGATVVTEFTGCRLGLLDVGAVSSQYAVGVDVVLAMRDGHNTKNHSKQTGMGRA
eukprot:m.480724 g.480724  ORF g.480724 m.480724 type:complete len:69 (+) comp53948_c0_seq1:190-396(+)